MFALLRTSIRLSGLFCLALGSLSVQAQVFPRGNGMALAGLDRADLYVEIRSWIGIAEDQTQFRLSTQRLFETGLRSAGVTRRAADKHYLVCSLQAQTAGNLLAYSTRLEYWNIKSTEVHALLWENGGLSTVATNQFNEKLVADECLRLFTEEWSKWNPRT